MHFLESYPEDDGLQTVFFAFGDIEQTAEPPEDTNTSSSSSDEESSQSEQPEDDLAHHISLNSQPNPQALIAKFLSRLLSENSDPITHAIADTQVIADTQGGDAMQVIDDTELDTSNNATTSVDDDKRHDTSNTATTAVTEDTLNDTSNIATTAVTDDTKHGTSKFAPATVIHDSQHGTEHDTISDEEMTVSTAKHGIIIVDLDAEEDRMIEREKLMSKLQQLQEQLQQTTFGTNFTLANKKG